MKLTNFLALVLLAVGTLCSCKKADDKGKDESIGYCMQYKDLEMDTKFIEGGKVKYNVLTPPGFDPNGGEKYCVIYLLHGAGDNNSAWLASPQERGGQTSLASAMLTAYKAGAIPKTVVIMPDAQMSFYMGGFEDFFYKEFMPQVESRFGIDSRKECRAVAGLSMGGFGSVYYGLKYPDLYCYVFSMSMAAFEPLYTLANEANKSTLPFFYITNGTMDSTVGKAPDDFYSYISSLGLACEFESWPGGHDWKFWGECIPKFLDKIGTEFKKSKQ